MKNTYIACVLAMDGTRLMPCRNPKKVRRLLKEGRAVIAKHRPFTIQLTYETTKNVQPIEFCEDTGEAHIGISSKSERHEFFHEQRDLSTNEKQNHDAQRSYRRGRRNRKRYRKPRFDNKNIPKGWLAPTLRHKKDQHVMLYERYLEVMPVTDITLEVGQFDTQALIAAEKGKPIPEGTDYQHGPRFGYDNLREAVFARDSHTCQVCGSTIGKIKKKDGTFKAGTVILRMHHLGFKTGDHTDRMDNLLTVCTRCHTAKNHKPGGALYELEPKSKPFKGAAFMNTVRWYIVNEIRNIDPNVKIHITYGSVTKRERLSRRMEKTHANDAYCMGHFRPKHRAYEVKYKKVTRNNRQLERFYDAKYIDTRDGSIKKGSQIGCNRTDRSESRQSDKNERIYHGKKISKGHRSIRKRRHPYQAGDIVLFQGKKRVVKTGRTKYPDNSPPYETVEFQDEEKQYRIKDMYIYRYVGAWKRV